MYNELLTKEENAQIEKELDMSVTQIFDETEKRLTEEEAEEKEVDREIAEDESLIPNDNEE